MPATGKRTQTKASRRSGQALLETVFTMLPTFALIFAFVDFGLLLFRWSTLQNAVRAFNDELFNADLPDAQTTSATIEASCNSMGYTNPS